MGNKSWPLEHNTRLKIKLKIFVIFFMLVFDILLCIILVGFFCICGGFAAYGCYRCCTDKGKTKLKVITVKRCNNNFFFLQNLALILKVPSRMSCTTRGVIRNLNYFQFFKDGINILEILHHHQLHRLQELFIQ